MIISIAGAPLLEQTLGALALQNPEPPSEVIVVRRTEDANADARNLSALCTGARVVNETGNVPRRRARGIAEARGEVIAIIEDTCVPAPGWARAIRSAHARGDAAVGGSVIPAPGLPAASAAAFLVEFGAYLPSDGGAAHEALHLPGCNLSYSRALLDANHDAWRDGLYETFFNARSAERGARVSFEPAALVVYGARTTLARAMSDRFHHGRTYGGIRHRGRGLARFAIAAAGALLVPLIALRIARSISRAGSHGRRLWSAYPWTLPLAVAWAAGESLGALAGAGSSPEKWS
ncbi:MAG: glycosyltransferase [bacterium]